MTLLYVYRGQGPSDELKISLRSVDAHLANVDRVALAGEGFPDWLSDDVVRIPVDSPYGRKQMNILHAVLAGLSVLGCGPCLYSSDDHVMLADFDADDFPWFANGPMPAYEGYAAAGMEISPYRGSMAETRRLLEKNGYPCDAKMSGHFNTHLDGRDAAEVSGLAGAYWDTPWGYEPSELFAAVARRRDPAIRPVHKYDSKIQWPSDAGYIEREAARSCGMISTTEFAMAGGDLRKWLYDKFPHRSRWEK